MLKRTNLPPEFSSRKNFIVIPPKISDRHGFLRYTINDYARNLNYHPRRNRREASPEEKTESKPKSEETQEKELSPEEKKEMAIKQAENLEEIIRNAMTIDTNKMCTKQMFVLAI